MSGNLNHAVVIALLIREAMIMGSSLEADQRVREFEAKVRMQKRMLKDRAVWEKYEKEFEPVIEPIKPQ